LLCIKPPFWIEFSCEEYSSIIEALCIYVTVFIPLYSILFNTLK
jgi:hypothetical protein